MNNGASGSFHSVFLFCSWCIDLFHAWIIFLSFMTYLNAFAINIYTLFNFTCKFITLCHQIPCFTAPFRFFRSSKNFTQFIADGVRHEYKAYLCCVVS